MVVGEEERNGKFLVMMGGFGACSLEEEGNFDPTHTEFCRDISTRLSTLYYRRHATITTLCRGCGSWGGLFCVALFLSLC